MNCPKFKLSIDEYLEDQLDRDDRRAFREHLQTCAECRAAAVVLEPSLLLAAGVPVKTDDRAVGECAETVNTLIRQERLRRRLAPASRRWLAVAALCVMVLGGGLLWRVAPWGVDSQPEAVTVAKDQSEADVVAPPPRLEVEMPDSAVRVYQFAGSDSETTAVYFVVNEKMEL